jgi:hypothetical protein
MRIGLNSSLPAHEPAAETEAKADAGPLPATAPSSRMAAARRGSMWRRPVLAASAGLALGLTFLLAVDAWAGGAAVGYVTGALQPLVARLRSAHAVEVLSEMRRNLASASEHRNQRPIVPRRAAESPSEASPVRDLQAAQAEPRLNDAYPATSWFAEPAGFSEQLEPSSPRDAAAWLQSCPEARTTPARVCPQSAVDSAPLVPFGNPCTKIESTSPPGSAEVRPPAVGQDNKPTRRPRLGIARAR